MQMLYLLDMPKVERVSGKGYREMDVDEQRAQEAEFDVEDLDLNCTVNLNEMDIRWQQLRPDHDAYSSSQHHWIAALQGRVPLLPTAQIALQTMMISEGIYLSDQFSFQDLPLHQFEYLVL
nr:hypothetical protein [Paenibacillus donghaensis]